MVKLLLANIQLFLILIILSFFLILLDNLNFLNWPKAGVQFITSPIQFGLYKTQQGVTHQFDFIFIARKTIQEKDALTEQYAQVLSDNARLTKELSETKAMVEQQNALNSQTFSLITVRPIGISRYLYIDKGSDDGVQNNQIAIYKDNYIGKVIEVSPKKAKVILASDPDSHVSGFIGSQNGKARGVVNGQFGSELMMDKILHQEPVEINDLVYTEGTEIEIPRGLIIGRVSEVVNKDEQTFKQAKIEPVFETANLEVIFLITN